MEVGGRGGALGSIVVAGRIAAETDVGRQLQHNGTHHFVVFVVQDVTVVDVPRELPQLIARHVEVLPFPRLLLRKVRLRPSDAIPQRFEWLQKGSVFPTGVIGFARRMAVVLHVFIRIAEASLFFKGVLQNIVEHQQTFERGLVSTELCQNVQPAYILTVLLVLWVNFS